jgi:hypothetical protein
MSQGNNNKTSFTRRNSEEKKTQYKNECETPQKRMIQTKIASLTAKTAAASFTASNA